jgi:hypothetical protein
MVVLPWELVFKAFDVSKVEFLVCLNSNVAGFGVASLRRKIYIDRLISPNASTICALTWSLSPIEAFYHL